MSDEISRENNYLRDEVEARDEAFLAGPGLSAADGRLWNEAWEAARRFYTPDPDGPATDPANWTCQIGEIERDGLPEGSDNAMRDAAARAYRELTGRQPDYIFSGWGNPLPERYRAVVEDREPQLAGGE